MTTYTICRRDRRLHYGGRPLALTARIPTADPDSLTWNWIATDHTVIAAFASEAVQILSYAGYPASENWAVRDVEHAAETGSPSMVHAILSPAVAKRARDERDRWERMQREAARIREMEGPA